MSQVSPSQELLCPTPITDLFVPCHGHSSLAFHPSAYLQTCCLSSHVLTFHQCNPSIYCSVNQSPTHSLYLSIHLSIHPLTCHPSTTHPSVTSHSFTHQPPIHPSTHPFIPIHPLTCPSIHHLSIHPPIHPSSSHPFTHQPSIHPTHPFILPSIHHPSIHPHAHSFFHPSTIHHPSLHLSIIHLSIYSCTPSANWGAGDTVSSPMSSSWESSTPCRGNQGLPETRVALQIFRGAGPRARGPSRG